jgi:phosphatidylethanolamine/phosphatidyl-N-methylethanolamine N-methyltransferase
MPDSSNRSRWRDHALIFGHFVRHPGTVGTVTPSSEYLAREMVQAIDPNRQQTVVELGPGTGAFTAEILARLGEHDRFLAIEVEPDFVRQLRARFPSTSIACASATDLATLAERYGLLPIDHIISGLPFATLPAETTRQILDAIQTVLRPGGTFTTFQYLHAYALPRAIALRRELGKRLGGPPSRTTVFRNLPPAFALSWRLTRAT